MHDPDGMDADLWDGEDEDTQKDRYLTFLIGEQAYAIEIRHVTEIVSVQKITEVPDMPPFVRGVINLRGQVIPVVDVRLRFSMQARDYDDRTCIVIVSMRGSAVGLIVDIVREVMNVPEADLSPPPRVSRGDAGRFISGMARVGEEVRIVLDVDRLLYEEDLARIEGLAEKPEGGSDEN